MQTDSYQQQAAVLVPVYRLDSDIRLVIIRRAAHGIHGGQLAFPGGRREPGDASLEATALREAHEEIGIAMASTEVLARLPEVNTMVSGYLVTPYLAKIRPPNNWTLQAEEVAEVIDVSLVELARPDSHGVETWQLPGWQVPRQIAFFRVGHHQLWGASYRILQPILARLVAGEWAI